MLIFSLTFGYRIYVEESVLVSELGDEYVKYTKRTKRLIPIFYKLVTEDITKKLFLFSSVTD